MGQKSYRIWLIVLALTGAAVDQASKYGVFGWLYKHPMHYDASNRKGEREVVADWFKLHVQYTDKAVPEGSALLSWSADQMPRVNKGALFGLGNDHEGSANSLFALISVVAGAAIIGWSFRASAARDRLLCAALGLILAGTLGNLYDRLVFGGVRDFLYFYRVEWPVFNFADCCLVCGALMLLAQAFLTQPHAVPAPAADRAEAAIAPQVVSVQ